MFQMALKCADICNPCRPWELSKQWSEKVTEEFFHQGTQVLMMTKLFAFATSSLRSKVNLCALTLSSYLGDIEKKHKLEISPLCDSEANTIASVQIGKNM